MTNSRHRCIWWTSWVAVAAVCVIGSYGRGGLTHVNSEIGAHTCA